MRKNILIIAILILASVLALMLRVEYQSPRQPKVSITFLGFTNDPTGVRLVKFVLSNSEPSAVQFYSPLIVARTAAVGEDRFVTESSGMPAFGVLGARASKTLVFPSPTNQLPWSVNLNVDSDVGMYRNVKHFMFYQMLKAGFKPKYQTMPYTLRSDWLGTNE